MVTSTLRDCTIYIVGTLKPDWTMQRLRQWIEREASGTVTLSLTDETTHAVMTMETWHSRSDAVAEVISRKAEGQNIHVVDYTWLEDSLEKRARKNEKRYMLEQAGRCNHAVEKMKNHAGLSTKIFLTSTDSFVDPEQDARLDRKLNAEQEAHKETLAEKQRIYECHRDQNLVARAAQVFKRGVLKARREILSDNHHIYVDSTQFPYSILITKVDRSKHHKHEQQSLTLQLYESNAKPYTYAFACVHTGTHMQTTNNIICPIGSNFLTSFRCFKVVFKEQTGGDWDNRVKDAEAGSQRCIQNHSDLQAPRRDFHRVPFIYHPPEFGPIGEIAEQVARQEAASRIIYRDGKTNDSGMSGQDEKAREFMHGPVFIQNDRGSPQPLHPYERPVEDPLDWPFDDGDRVAREVETQAFRDDGHLGRVHVSEQAQEPLIGFVEQERGATWKRKKSDLQTAQNNKRIKSNHRIPAADLKGFR